MRSSLSASVLIALGLVFSPVAAQAAILFDFYWSGDPGATAATASSDHTLLGMGRMEIDAGAGESFDQSDVLSLNLTFSGQSISPFTIDAGDDLVFSGVIDALGGTASLLAYPSPTMISGANFFGCLNSGCGSSDFRVVVSNAPGQDQVVDYGSAADAAGSMTLTAVALPLPSALPLAAVGLALLGLFARRRPA